MRVFVYLPGFVAVFLFACASSPVAVQPVGPDVEPKAHAKEVDPSKVRVKHEDAQLIAKVKELEEASRSQRFRDVWGVQPVGPDVEPKAYEPSVLPVTEVPKGIEPAKVAVQPVGPDVEPKVRALTPNETFAELVRGNERFVQDHLQNFNAQSFRSRALASDPVHKPQVAILLPSYAQVNPELVFDQKLGSIYSIRAISNVLGAAQVASIEYAVKHMGVQLVVILDQEPKLLQTHAKGESLDLDWVLEQGKDENRYPASESQGKDVLINQLVQRSRIIREASEQGKVKVIRGVYRTESGRIEFL